MPYKNPSLHREAIRKNKKRWYEDNKAKAIGWVAERNKRVRTEIQTLLSSYKAVVKCQECGEDDPVVLDFHHRDPSEKDITLAQAASNGWSIERILAEIAKCDVLCANCHRRVHHVLRYSGSREGAE